MAVNTTKIDQNLKSAWDALILTRIRVIHSLQNKPKMFTIHGIRHLELSFTINDNWIGHEFVQGPTVSFRATHVTEPWLTDQYDTLAEMMREIEGFESNA